MLLDFKTKQNRNGNTYYLRIETSTREYSRMVPYIIAPDDAITVTKDEYNKLLKKLKFYDFKEIECVYY